MHPSSVDRIDELPRKKIPDELRQELLGKLEHGVVILTDLTEQLITHRRLSNRIEQIHHQSVMNNVLKNLTSLHVVVLDRLVLIRANIALEERNGDKTTIERFRLVLRRRQLVDAEHTQATALGLHYWTVLDIDRDPVMSHPCLEF